MRILLHYGGRIIRARSLTPDPSHSPSTCQKQGGSPPLAADEGRKPGWERALRTGASPRAQGRPWDALHKLLGEPQL
eukprot:5039518-Prymnesium_polylepis.1